jgi:hypothetical protein
MESQNPQRNPCTVTERETNPLFYHY